MAGSLPEALALPVARERWKYSRFARFESALGQAKESSPAQATTTGPVTTQTGLDPDDLPAGLLPPRAAYPLLEETLAASSSLLHLRIDSGEAAKIDLQRAAGASGCFIDVAANGEAHLTLTQEQDEGSHTALFLRIGANANVTVSLSIRDQTTLSWTYLGIDLERDSRLSLQQTLLGSGEHRVESRLRLLGPGADVAVTGGSLAVSGARFDQQLTMEHVAPHCTSNQRIHAAADAGGRSTFNGRIHIHPKAPGTQADLNNSNLLLADSAEINSKPELEIYTDDVRCSHGSTVGALDPDALFLLRSRGIPPHLARRLLITGFLKSVLQGSTAEADAAALVRHLEDAS